MSQIPSNIGRYDVMNPIGQGGMGSLFLAWDPKLERKIAIKLLRDDDESLRERFSREARAAARLRHPNIVTIFDVGDHEGQPFIAMEYIQGHTLAEMIHRQTPMSLTRKLELMEALCDGLGFAHKGGIVHRDIKPANLMVDVEGALKILDFGIARASESSGMTQAGMLIGTLNYMSPEQVSGATVDARSDIFAVGAVCYELLAHKQAFPGGLLAGILNRILMAQFEPLASVAPDLDPDVVRIINKALERDPANRYQELQSMRKELLFLRMRLESQPGMELAEPASDSPTIVVPTPMPVRRTSDREDLLRRRAAQIEAHLAEARQQLDAGRYEAAIAAGEQALVLDADHHVAHELIDRARAAHEASQLDEYLSDANRELERGAVTAAGTLLDRAAHLNPEAPGLAEVRERLAAAAREQQEARQRADAVRALVARAQAAYENAAFADALALADQALAIDAASADAQAVRSRAEQARDDEARAAHEARARQAIDDAERAFKAGRHEEAIAALSAFAPPHAIATRALDRIRAEAQRMADARQREEERLARIAGEIAAHVEAADALLARGEREQALARASAALALDAQHQAARDLRTKIEVAIRAEAERTRAEEAKRRAEEAAARQRQKASAAALKQARKAKTPQAAIAVLTPALRVDPDHAELRLMLEAKQADQARASAAARAPASDTEKTAALPRMVPGATAAPRPATPAPGRQPTALIEAATALAGRQPMVLVGAAAILVVLLVAGYFAFSGSDAPPAIDQTATTAAASGETAAAPPPVPSDPTPASPVAQDPLPATPPAPPPAEAPPTEADAAAAKADTLNQQIATALRNARRQLQDGDRAAALATAEGGLRLRANDRDLMAVVGELTSDARTRALAAKSGAEAFGGHATSLPAFRDAEARVAEADRSAGARRLPEAARAFWQAEELFTRAATDGRTAKDAADREAAAAAAAAPPPPVAKPAPPPPPAVNPDETAIRALMQRYADAYTRSDANAVASVTTLQASALRRGFDQLSSQRMQLTDLKITLESAQRARVECQLVHEMQPKAGAQNTVKGPATFVLEKRNGAWIVLQRR